MSPPAGISSDTGEVSVVIPNYNGVRHGVIDECLTSLRAAQQRDPRLHEVIVVDDASTDGSAAHIREFHPWVTLIVHDRNRGFLAAANTGMRAVRHEYTFLVNSDIIFTPNFLAPLLACLNEPDVFAVCPALVSPDGSTFQSGVNLGGMRGGHIALWNESQTQLPPVSGGPLPTVFAIGAAMLCRRTLLAELGYFDTLYAPSNWEDIDLCYRAWMRGYRCLYQPASVLHHHLHRTIDREYSDYNKHCLAAKNEYSFIWKNIHDTRYLWHHLRRFTRRVEERLAAGDSAVPHGLAWALGQFPRTLRARSTERRHRMRSDRAIFTTVQEAYLAAQARMTARRKILFVTQEFPWPQDTGGKDRNYHLLTRLSREFDISLLALTEDAAACDTARLGCCTRVRPITRMFIPAVNDRPDLPATVAESSESALWGAINGEIDSWHPDIIVYDSLLVSVYLLLNEVSIPAVYIEHDTGMADPRASYLWRRRTGTALAWFAESMKLLRFTRQVCDRATEIITLTDHDTASLHALGVRTPITVAPTATDTEQFRPRRQRTHTGTPELVYLGHFRHHPNTDALLHFCRACWPQLRGRHPELRLRIIGSGPGDDLQALAQADPRITVTGYVADLPAALDGDYIFIAPLRLGGGIRGKILQGLAMELPVVATPNAASGFTRALRDCLTVAALDAPFIAALETLIADPEQRRMRGARGRAVLSEQYNWDRTAADVATVLRRAHARKLNFPVRSL